MPDDSLRRLARLLGALALAGCAGSTTAPGHVRQVDLATARAAWEATHPPRYTFEIAVASSWFPRSSWLHVRVAAGQVVAADSGGRAIGGFTMTIDTLWARVLEARDHGQLNSATFESRGVPLEVDYGPWPVDGGVHYSVRNFDAAP